MVSRHVSTIIYAAILVFHCFVLKKYSRNHENPPQDALESLKSLKKFRYFYLTTWNFALQVLFLIIAVASDITRSSSTLKTFNTFLTRLRSNLFTSITFPLSLMVASVFWPVYFYDKDLMLPKGADHFLPFWMNHSLHTFILIPLAVEVFLARGGTTVKLISTILRFTFFLGAYESLYFFIYFQFGVFLYPIYYKMNWTQTLTFTLVSFLFGVIYLVIGVTLNNKNQRQMIITTSKTK